MVCFNQHQKTASQEKKNKEKCNRYIVGAEVSQSLLDVRTDDGDGGTNDTLSFFHSFSLPNQTSGDSDFPLKEKSSSRSDYVIIRGTYKMQFDILLRK